MPLTGLRGFLAKFTVLKTARRELWLTFLIKFLIYTAYSITNKTMVLWLSKDLGFSDQAAGLDTIFLVFTAILLVTVPLVLLIPEAVKQPVALPQTRRPVVVAASAQKAAPVGQRARSA